MKVTPALFLFIFILTGWNIPILFFGADKKECHPAFNYHTKENDFQVSINICSDSAGVLDLYKTTVNMPVCDDTLCANVILEIFWDLAGNYLKFDTIASFQLTKFDHKKFTSADYRKLDEILKDKNSILRVMRKNELVDKSVQVKATTVDAITGATPQTIKNSVVEGAVYTSYSLWHFVNGVVTDSMKSYTQTIFSESVARKLVTSDNYETQLFALKQWSGYDFERNFDLLSHVIGQSVPLVKAYVIGKVPLPLNSSEKNKQFVLLFKGLDNYSKSIFINRITSDKETAKILIPKFLKSYKGLAEKQLVQIQQTCKKYDININEDQNE